MRELTNDSASTSNRSIRGATLYDNGNSPASIRENIATTSSNDVVGFRIGLYIK